jgi:choline dehydrogenase-like flavoprotein
MQMYMHGLALPRSVQKREGLLNCALFMLEEHAHDDPIMALKRLMHGNRTTFARDLVTVLKSPGPVTKGLGIKAFQSDKIPERLKTSLINAIVRINPNFAVREHLHRGVQYKLLGIRVEGISEQCPDPESRVMLSPSKDVLGVQRAIVSWKVDKIARRSLSRLGQLLGSELSRVGLPPPLLEDWLAQERLDDAPVIDMAHTMGTTRMSDNPRNGVVDANCRVHGVQGLYIAGGSVFPTGGHSNPTLMILALAIRLADHLKAVFEDSLRTTTR